MIVIPAIDIIEGKCVRLTRGDFKTKKIYDDDPLKIAVRWKDSGSEWLHIIDLDGARYGKVGNLNIALKIKSEVGLKIQYGGGIRDRDILKKVLHGGIDRAILGTGILEDMDFLKYCVRNEESRVIISLDYGKGGIVFKDGWRRSARVDVFGILKKLEDFKVEKVIITDISRDGTLEGTDLDFLEKMLQSTSIRFIIAGGIGSLEDIRMLKRIEGLGVDGVIVGKALYEDRADFDLKEAIRIGERHANQEDNTMSGCE